MKKVVSILGGLFIGLAISYFTLSDGWTIHNGKNIEVVTLDANKDVENSNNITINFSKDVDKKFVHDTQNMLKLYEKESKNFFTLQNQYQIEVNLYTKEEFRKHEADRIGISSYYDFKKQSLNLPVPNEAISRELPHEYMHFLFIMYLNEKGIEDSEIPVWFHEGVSDYFALKNNFDVDYEGYNRIIKFNQLNTHDDWDDAFGKPAIDRYHQAYLGVRMLVELKSIGVIEDIVFDVSEGNSFYSALENKTNLPIEKFEKKLQEYIRNDYQLQH